MAQRSVIRLAKSSADLPVTYANQPADKVYYILPIGVSAASVDKPVLRGYIRYTGPVGSLSKDCGLVLPPLEPEPEGEGPIVKPGASVPDLIPGVNYDFQIPFGAFIPYGDQQIIVIQEVTGGLPSWLSLIQSPGQPPSLRGKAPLDAQATFGSVRAYQTDGKSVVWTFPINVTPNSALAVYALLRTETENRRLIPFVGGQASTPPTVQIVKAPAGWANFGAYVMEPFAASFTLTGLEYYFRYLGYSGAPDGEYVFKIIHLGRTRYATGTMSGSADLPMDIATTPPASYLAQGLASLDEGSSSTPYELVDNSTGTPVVLSGATASLENAKTGTSINSVTRVMSVIQNSVPNDGYDVVVKLQKGSIVARRTVTIVDKTVIIPAPVADPVTRAIYRRQAGNFSPPRLVNISARTQNLGTIQIAYRLNGETAAVIESEWQDMSQTGLFQDTNQAVTKLYAAGDTSMTVYLRAKSSPAAVSSFVITLPFHETTYQVASLSSPVGTDIITDVVLGATELEEAANACDLSIQRIRYEYDEGNQGLTIKTLSSGGVGLQFKLTGPSPQDWTNLFALTGENFNGFWAQAGRASGNYIVSVRPQGSTGIGCSFAFTLPGAGSNLYIKS